VAVSIGNPCGNSLVADHLLNVFEWVSSATRFCYERVPEAMPNLAIAKVIEPRYVKAISEAREPLGHSLRIEATK
jgi:hypothetical protein